MNGSTTNNCWNWGKQRVTIAQSNNYSEHNNLKWFTCQVNKKIGRCIPKLENPKNP